MGHETDNDRIEEAWSSEQVSTQQQCTYHGDHCIRRDPRLEHNRSRLHHPFLIRPRLLQFLPKAGYQSDLYYQQVFLDVRLKDGRYGFCVDPAGRAGRAQDSTRRLPLVPRLHPSLGRQARSPPSRCRLVYLGSHNCSCSSMVDPVVPGSGEWKDGLDSDVGKLSIHLRLRRVWSSHRDHGVQPPSSPEEPL